MRRRRGKRFLKIVILLTLGLISLIFFVTGILYYEGFFIPQVHSIKQEVWLSSDPKEPPIAILVFEFSSKGSFTANYPIHVKVKMMISSGINLTDIMPVTIVFPDAYMYPRVIEKPGMPPTAGIVSLSLTQEGITGEADIEFTSRGIFGYIIFSKDSPAYYAANSPLIEIAPYETRLQIESGEKNLGITLIGVAITIFVALLLYLIKAS